MSLMLPSKAAVSCESWAGEYSLTASVPRIVKASVSRSFLIAPSPWRSVTWPTSCARTAASCSSVAQVA